MPPSVRVQELRCGGCQLGQLPPGLLAALPRLVVLDLSGNELSDWELALGVHCLLAAASLGVGAGAAGQAAGDGEHAGSALAERGGVPVLMPLLQTLDLSHNALAALPAWLPPGLLELHAGFNSIPTLDAWACTRLTRLQVLGLQHNRLEELPQALTKLVELQQLCLEGNPGVASGCGGWGRSRFDGGGCGGGEGEGGCWAAAWLREQKRERALVLNRPVAGVGGCAQHAPCSAAPW